MRIAYVTADQGVPVFGTKGCSVHVLGVVRAFRRRGADVEVFAARLGSDAPQDLRDVRVWTLPRAPEGSPAERERAALAANGDLRAALARSTSPDLVYERYSLWSYAGMEFAREIGVPGVLEINAPLIEEQAEHRGLSDPVAAGQVAERVSRAAAVRIAVSDEVAKAFEKHGPAGGRIFVVPNGVDPERFPERIDPALPASPGTFTVGFLGTLKPWHGLATLAEAFALLSADGDRATRLLVVGDGPERGDLEKELRRLGLLERAVFTGAVAPAQVPSLLASMDAAVAPYPAGSFYFSPLKVFEAMAAGVPVVASRVGQLAQVVRDGVDGILCAPGDAGGFAAALERLWRSPALRARLGTAARRTVLEKYTWDLAAGRVLDLAAESAAVRVTES
jgi:glycosyltransferase involved in cell wall biosynthesis